MNIARFLGITLTAALAMFACSLTAGPAAAAGDTRCGDASWYGPSGKLTASGEVFQPGALTAAHRTAPFGTKFIVLREDRTASVVVHINDRGPFTRGRIIDLSPAAAKRIGLQGVSKVCIVEMPRSRLRRS